MKSKVIRCVAYVDEESGVCLCGLEDFKVCPKRIKENLECRESIVRITPLEREATEDVGIDLSIAKMMNKELEGIKNNFADTLRHLDKMK